MGVANDRAMGALLMVLIAAGCGGELMWDVEEGVSRSGTQELAGFWVGSARITDWYDAGGTDRIRDGDVPGFSFPVALELREDLQFRLISFNYPPTGSEAGRDRECEGVYFTRGVARLQFFPARSCPALPLSTYSVGRTADRLRLEAATDVAGVREAGAETASVRVILVLERADRVPGRGEDFDTD